MIERKPRKKVECRQIICSVPMNLLARLERYVGATHITKAGAINVALDEYLLAWEKKHPQHSVFVKDNDFPELDSDK